METKRVCPSCHAECASDTRFCGLCGAPLPEATAASEAIPTKCPICGAVATPGMKFCGACGTALGVEQVEIVRRVRRPKKPREKMTKERLHTYLRAGLLLLLSALMLGFAFLPVYHVELYYEKEAEYDGVLGIEPRATEGLEAPDGDLDFSLSAIDTVVLFVDTVYNQKDPASENTRLIRRLRDARYDLYEAQNEFSKDRDLDTLSGAVGDFVFLLLRLEARDVTADPTVMMGAMALLSVAYLAVALVAFVLALLTLLHAVGVLRGRTHFRGAATALLLLPLLLLGLSVLAGHLFSEIPQLLVGLLDSGLSYDTGFYSVNLYLGFGAALALLAERIVFARGQLVLRRVICTAITLVLCLTSFLMLLAPLMNADIVGYFDRDDYPYLREVKAPISVGCYNLLHQNFGSLRKYERDMGRTATSKGEFFEERLNGYLDYKVEDIENGAADAVSTSVLSAALVANMAATPAFLVGMGASLATVAFAVLSLLAAHAALVDLALGGRVRRPGFGLRIAAAVLAILLLALVILSVVIINDRIDRFNFHTDAFTLRIAAGPILLVIFAIGALFVPRGAHRIVQYVEGNAPSAPTDATSSAEAETPEGKGGLGIADTAI